jgi:aldose 1-epimerase
MKRLTQMTTILLIGLLLSWSGTSCSKTKTPEDPRNFGNAGGHQGCPFCSGCGKKPTTDRKENKMSITKKPYGKLQDGQEVDLYTLVNPNGITARVITYGATLIGVDAPDRDGKMANITLHKNDLAGYEAGHPFFGAIAGRFANRIAGGKFSLDGKEYSLATNNGPNHLHGGKVGFDKKVWAAEEFEKDGEVGVKLSYTSADGEEGYPGNLETTVVYSLNDKNQLTMDYTATTDAPTPVNLTNHAYWNLAGAGSGKVVDQILMLGANEYLPVDDTLIPLGEPATVKETVMDFTKEMPIGSRIDKVPGGGYDHCYVLDKTEADKNGLSLVARVSDPNSGRTMDVFTTQPGVQLYTANFLDGSDKSGGYTNYEGFCLETQHYPDSPNQPKFPTTVLKPGETYHETTVHQFGVEK